MKYRNFWQAETNSTFWMSIIQNKIESSKKTNKENGRLIKKMEN